MDFATVDFDGSGSLDLPEFGLLALLSALLVTGISVMTNGVVRTSVLASKQLLVMLMMACAVQWWLTTVTAAEFGSIWLVATATLLLVEGLLYLQLPMDLIPDSIPFVGQLDDYAATLGALLGLTALLLCFYGGTAPADSAAASLSTGGLLAGAAGLVPMVALVGTGAVLLAAQGGPGVRQLGENVIGLATGRLRVVNIDGERAVVAVR
jgi:hypothetical protein